MWSKVADRCDIPKMEWTKEMGMKSVLTLITDTVKDDGR